MLEVVRASYRGGYRLRVQFNDGTAGVVDLEADLWGPMFEPLKDIGRFRRFSVSTVLHTVVWENEADFAPEFLKARIAAKTRKRGAPPPRAVTPAASPTPPPR